MASSDGQRLQRYFRDQWSTISRTTQVQFFAADTARLYFEAQVGNVLGNAKPRLLD